MRHNMQLALSAIREVFYGRVPQVFFSHNIVGDPMEPIYDDGVILVDACFKYDYIECFGLTNDEEGLIVEEYKMAEALKKMD